jgi:hypothetical protein
MKRHVSESDTLRLTELIQSISILHRHLQIRLFNILPIHLQPCTHDIPRLDWPHTFWRTRQNDITLLQRHNPANIAQLPGDSEQHELSVVGLFHLAIHRQPDVRILGVWDARLRNQVTDGHECVEALGDAPWETLLFGFVLHVSRGHVDGEEVACIMSRQMR